MIDSDLLPFRVAVASVAVPEGINTQIPCTAVLQPRECDCNILPVAVDRHVDNIIASVCAVISGEADAESMCIARNIDFVCVGVVRVDRIHATDGIRQLFADDRVAFAEPDHGLEKGEELLIFCKQTPVEPGNLIVLAVAVVVAILRVAEFIAGEEHRRAAAAHEHGTGVPDHPVAEL